MLSKAWSPSRVWFPANIPACLSGSRVCLNCFQCLNSDCISPLCSPEQFPVFSKFLQLTIIQKVPARFSTSFSGSQSSTRKAQPLAPQLARAAAGAGGPAPCHPPLWSRALHVRQQRARGCRRRLGAGAGLPGLGGQLGGDVMASVEFFLAEMDDNQVLTCIL